MYMDTDAGEDPHQGLPSPPEHHADPVPPVPLDPEPGPDPEPELPPDPFPDWYQFTAAHPLPAADTDDPGWPEPLDDPYPECLLLHAA
jgi:hypothetical protein